MSLSVSDCEEFPLSNNEKEGVEMTKLIKSNSGLTREKKDILKKAVGSASSSKIDLNKVRDNYKYERQK